MLSFAFVIARTSVVKPRVSEGLSFPGINIHLYDFDMRSRNHSVAIFVCLSIWIRFGNDFDAISIRL